MEEEKLDEILAVLQEIKDDMGGISAKRLEKKVPMADSLPESVETPEDEAIETPELQAVEEEEGEEDVSHLPRWKQRLHAFGKKKIGM